MAKSLVILALLATQLLSWSGGSVYLCICGKGTVCVDGGPSACTCCATSEGAGLEDANCTKPENAECCESCCAATNRHREQSRKRDTDQCANSSRGCAHIQILHEQAPSVCASSCDTNVGHLSALLASPPCGLPSLSEIEAPTDPRTRMEPSSAPSLLLTFLAATALRC